MNAHWGYGAADVNYKSLAHLIETLCACRRVGANYLLNIGPTAQGGVDPFQRELMATLGKWMKLFGEAIYLGRPHGARCSSKKNFALKSDDHIYFFIHDLARVGDVNVTVGGNYQGAHVFTGVPETIESIAWMDDEKPLPFTQNDSIFAFNAVGYPYGKSTCVRVAKAKIKK
jgi:alpha-L-fucosidase